jgi:hypothetical protein
MTTRALLFLVSLAAPLAAQPPTLTRADTLAIKRLAAEAGVDTAKAQVRVKGDTAWVWHRSSPTYSRGAELRRAQGQWVRHSSSDTSTAVPGVPPHLQAPARNPPPLVAQTRALTREDTLAIKKLAATYRIDTAHAQLRVHSDTAWIWSHPERFAIGMELIRHTKKWFIHSVSDNPSAIRGVPPRR